MPAAEGASRIIAPAMTTERKDPRPRLFLALPVLATLAFAGLPAAAQPPAGGDEPEQQQDSVFVDVVNVAVVNVDVYVTDKKGNRITDLKRDDFEILENGRPVTISNFAVVERGRLRRDAEAAPPDEAAAEAESEAPRPAVQAPPLPEDQRLHLVVYVDNYNIRPFTRNRVLRELRTFLRSKLDKDDRIMLVTYDRSLHVQHPWTSDPDIIASVLQELETMSGSALSRESDRRDALERIEESESVQGALSFAHTYAANIYNDLSFSIDSLREIVSGLAGLPGRKAILYVSEGLPMVAGEDLFYAVQERFREQTAVTDAFEYDASRRFQELTASANANRVTFYTIDVGGLRSYTYGDASHQLPGQGAFIEQVYVSNLQSPLQLMAETTGGKAIINANRVTGPLEAVAEDFDNFYSLGYTPSHFGDGRYYRIEVKIKDRKGLEIRHREGYRDKPAEVRMSDGTMSALLHQFESNPMELKLGFGPQNRNSEGQFVVPVRVSIPLGNIVLVPGERTHEARLRLFVAAMDADGGVSEVQNTVVPISIPNQDVAKARGQAYLYSVNLLMRGGRHRVAVGLRDEVGSEQSFIYGQLDVGAR